MGLLQIIISGIAFLKVANPKGNAPQARSGIIENDESKPELVIEI